METVIGLALPFIGTALGALLVFLLRGGLRRGVERSLLGFAAGIMAAASVWSLLLPALEQSQNLGAFRFLPAVAGFWIGVMFLRFGELLPQQERNGAKRQTQRMALTVVLHNIPEGMAVGVAFAGVLCGSPGATLAGALSLSLGIALQNIPEGAIISMPLYAGGVRRGRAFCLGVLSGAVEPLAAGLTLLTAKIVAPMLPYLLGFAAGAMICVAVEELIPQTAQSRSGTLWFTLGFTLMLALDVVF